MNYVNACSSRTRKEAVECKTIFKYQFIAYDGHVYAGKQVNKATVGEMNNGCVL